MNLNRYLNNLINLVFALFDCKYLSFYKKFYIFFITILSSNKISSFLFGFPILIIYKFSIKYDFIIIFLMKFNLLHLTLRFLSIDKFLEIRKRLFELELYNKNETFNIQYIKHNLSVNGYSKINTIVSKNTVDQIINLIDKATPFSAQVPSQGKQISGDEECFSFISFEISEYAVLSCADILLKDIEFHSLKKAISGLGSQIYSVNFYKNFPNKNNLHSVQKFHRDYDGFLCYVLFVALSDVTKSNGATIVINKSSGYCEYLEAKKGELYLLDPFILHRANDELTSNRFSCWIRFGEVPNLAFYQDLAFKQKIVNALQFLNRKL